MFFLFKLKILNKYTSWLQMGNIQKIISPKHPHPFAHCLPGGTNITSFQKGLHAEKHQHGSAQF